MVCILRWRDDLVPTELDPHTSRVWLVPHLKVIDVTFTLGVFVILIVVELGFHQVCLFIKGFGVENTALFNYIFMVGS